ncbi:GNAT family N-acetyltransferase [Paenibacillus sp. DMB20]|uniref:GNAT family N-acetyltransferase n=1 Tax=Paenibacillus sp. DMB20 TaxID=1642570 RepID=UPI000627931A|nr:GNAT family N-acetyltransferase [Paenibacillus sp. DMB20]KKO51732.1 hypothetical protein XI25_23620 [Paenibacillus sp. DMB20]
MLEYRDAVSDDFRIIANFPQNPVELFYMFPKGTYPVTPEQLEETALVRYAPTVITQRGKVVGYCNLYDVTEGNDSWLGNVIVHPGFRRAGIGEFLLNSMKHRARSEYACRNLKLICHNTNTGALLFYYRHGFKPFDMKVMEDDKGSRIAGIIMSLDLGLKSD